MTVNMTYLHNVCSLNHLLLKEWPGLSWNEMWKPEDHVPWIKCVGRGVTMD